MLRKARQDFVIGEGYIGGAEVCVLIMHLQPLALVSEHMAFVQAQVRSDRACMSAPVRLTGRGPCPLQGGDRRPCDTRRVTEMLYNQQVVRKPLGSLCERYNICLVTSLRSIKVS